MIEKTPAPQGDPDAPFKALLFDSWFDEYRGVICLMEIIDGSIKKGDRITSVHTDQTYEVLDIGIMHPEPTSTASLSTGQVGYIITGMKTVKEARTGDTFHAYRKPVTPLPGFKPAKPMVFAGIYPVETSEFDNLRDAIEKLTLNDPSVTVEKETSAALGFGFRCGFLGLLHMDVFTQRLEQEHNQQLITTSPTVLYQIDMTSGEKINLENPAEFPDVQKIAQIYEPVVTATIVCPHAIYW